MEWRNNLKEAGLEFSKDTFRSFFDTYFIVVLKKMDAKSKSSASPVGVLAISIPELMRLLSDINGQYTVYICTFIKFGDGGYKSKAFNDFIRPFIYYPNIEPEIIPYDYSRSAELLEIIGYFLRENGFEFTKVQIDDVGIDYVNVGLYLNSTQVKEKIIRLTEFLSKVNFIEILKIP